MGALGSVIDQQKDVSLYIRRDESHCCVAGSQVLSINKDTSFCWSTNVPLSRDERNPLWGQGTQFIKEPNFIEVGQPFREKIVHRDQRLLFIFSKKLKNYTSITILFYKTSMLFVISWADTVNQAQTFLGTLPILF